VEWGGDRLTQSESKSAARRGIPAGLSVFSSEAFVIRVAIPNKGRLSEQARELFDDAGLEVRANGDRALTASLGGEFQALFLRAQDIPEFVADGAADVGITGWDLVRESGRPLDTLLDLGFGCCRLVVAAREDSAHTTIADVGGGTRVATTFPRLTRNFFDDLGRSIEVVPVSGAAEIAPHLGVADVIVDLTSTGSTLRVNGLRELHTILESSARLVCAPGAAEGPVANTIADLVTALASVLRARGQRYVMANVPRAALERVRQVLPGLNGPTVVDILDDGSRVAVHAVVGAAAIYRTIAGLKRLGAEGVLVTRIERLMP
jgi:ATP phosphoribosyltransferase